MIRIFLMECQIELMAEKCMRKFTMLDFGKFV